MSNCEFESRKLYDQTAIVDEGSRVYCRVYAVSYLYPGAITRTTARCRTTFVYHEEAGEVVVAGGTIEKWTDRGWMTVDEIFDTLKAFYTVEDVLEHMISMFKAFTLGIPATNTVPRSPAPPPIDPRKPKKDPKLKVLSFKDALKTNSYTKKNTAPFEKEENDNGKKDDEDPDFDWI